MSEAQVSHNVQLISGENQLREFGSFLKKHQQQLRTFIAKDAEDICRTRIELNWLLPVGIDFESRYESLSMFQLINSDNLVMNKIIAVFVQLCEEVRHIRQQSDKFQLKFLHCDANLLLANDVAEQRQTEQRTGLDQQLIIVRISELLEFICQIQHLLNRCQTVALNIIKQLCALFADGRSFLNINTSIHFQSVFGYLADILLILETFNQIIKRSNVHQYWHLFCKSIDTACENADQFGGFNGTEVDALRSIVTELQHLFSDDLTKNCLDIICGMKAQLQTKSILAFSTHLQGYIKNLFTEIGNYDQDLSDGIESKGIIKVSLMCVLSHCAFGSTDLNIWKTLFEYNTKYCAIPLIENILWCLDEFVQRQSMPSQRYLSKYIIELNRNRLVLLQTKIAALPKIVHQFCYQLSIWAIKLSENFSTATAMAKLKDMTSRCVLLFEGIQLMGKMSFLIKSLTNLHIHLNTPMTKITLIHVCKVIEYLQIIRAIFQKNYDSIISIIYNVCQHLSYQALYIIETGKKKISNESIIYDQRIIDIISALQIAEKSMQGSTTHRRILIARIALSVADPIQIFSANHLDKLCKILTQQETMIDLRVQVNQYCNSSFMYWHQTMIPVYFKQLMDSGCDCGKLKYIFYAADMDKESMDLLEPYQMENTKNSLIDCQTHLRNIIIGRLCANIETHLRLDAHTNLSNSCPATATINPITNKLCELIDLKPIPYAGNHIIIKNHIEHYLSAMFYNLTTVALHDWRTYGEMRCLADMKLELKTVGDYLPTQTLEQGLDVLEIMRNIHVFVSQYSYNLNNQVFIQNASNNKHLDTINIRHIANSLRTHGMGIINTTVNFTYQFLRKKFNVFSQFLYDELIKSRLIKDLKYFRENRERLNQMYSYERAEQFCRGIKKLGLSENGHSYLDLFRQLISHIGNALGFVRMMRSGGIHCGSNSSVFLPNVDDNMMFAELVRENGSAEATIQAAASLEIEIKNMSSNSIEKTDYFQLLITAFAPFCRDQKNVHLKNFYLIVPPLTINFIEYILTAKDRMTKNKNKNESSFTDDGFAIGLVYIVKLLNQMSDFNSLYWFKSVRQKYLADREKLRQQQQTVLSQDDEKLQQTLSLTEKRINTFLEEFDLLYCNLSSAKNFFP